MHRYWAFISYSSKDARVAQRLHKALETYRIPRPLVGRPGRDEPVPRRIFPIFRDRDELPLSADLGATIEDALRASRYLIVICSPNAAASKWVNEEIRFFKSIGRQDRILAVIAEGEPNAADSGDPAKAPQECFPLALRRSVNAQGEITSERTEPIAGDLRTSGDGWTAAFLKCVAAITGLGYDAFARRQAARQRKKRIAMTIMALLVIAAGLFTWDYNRLKVAYYAELGSRWGAPEGIVPISLEIRFRRGVSYRVESRRYKVRLVERVNATNRFIDDPNRHSACRIEVIYREDGSVNQLRYYNHNRHLVMQESHSQPDALDGDGMRATTVRFETRGSFAQSLDSHAGALALERGDSGDRTLTEITALSVRYRSDGRVSSVQFRNSHGAPARNRDGSFGQRFDWNAVGLPIRTTNLDLNGGPLPDRRGVAVIVREYDGMGAITSTQYVGTDGAAAIGPEKFSCERYLRDPAGNPIACEYFDVRGQPVLHKEMYARWTAKCDDRGNAVETTFFGLDGKPTPLRDGVAGWTEMYDDAGNVIQRAFFGVDGKPTLNRFGYASCINKYDERGNMIQLTNLALDGKPVLTKYGNAGFTDKYDERGNHLERVYFGVDGKPTQSNSGYASRTGVYDDRGNRIVSAFFGADGKPTLTKFGVAGYTSKYDDRGNNVESAYFGVDGRPMLDPNGVAGWTNKFDERGNYIETVFIGVDGKPALHEDGVAGWSDKYDDRGNHIERACFGLNREPTLVKDGYARWTAKYDERGNRIETAYFGVDGKPTLHKDGYARREMTYDARGNELERRLFGVDGKPIEHKDGYTVRKQTFDNFGNVIRRVGIKLDGTEIELPITDPE